MAVNGTHNGHASQQLVGRVLGVNERGLRLEGRDGWLNYSKWAGEIAEPRRGQVVALTLDGSGFVRAVGPAGGARSRDTGGAPVRNGAPVQNDTGDAAAGPSKDTTITRLAILKDAAEFAAGRPDVKSGDVLAIAERWEGWVGR